MYCKIAYVRPDRLAVATILAAAMLPGCAQPEKDNGASGTDQTITRTAADGPVELSLTLGSDALAVNGRVRLVVAVTAERGVTVQTDDYLAALLEGDRRFELGATLVDKKEAVPEGDERLRWRYEYELTSYLPGEYELPGASVSYTNMGESINPMQALEEPKTHTLTTEPMTVVVADTNSKPLSQAELADIHMQDPVELRRPVSFMMWAGVIALVLVLGVAVYALRRRRGTDEAIRLIPAHLWAKAQLDALVADNLTAKGQVQEFYYRVSGIVRGYVERRFFVSAPEMTTEEFLSASRDDPRFAGSTASALGAFLTACDLVKYARHEPTSREADQAIGAAEDFIEQTRVRDEPTDMAAPAEQDHVPTRRHGYGGDAS